MEIEYLYCSFANYFCSKYFTRATNAKRHVSPLWKVLPLEISPRKVENQFSASRLDTAFLLQVVIAFVKSMISASGDDYASSLGDL